jgi:DNA-binding LytR/AlgR family response regulator
VFDIFLIDIGLGASQNGIALAEEIRRRGIREPILYLTADYTEATYNAAKHTHPSSFLNKELSRIKLLQAIDLAVAANKNSHVPTASSQTAAHIADNNLFFKVGDIFKSIKIAEVAFFYSDHKMSYAKVNHRSYPTNIQLKVLSEQLGGHGFFRVHKSYLVNLKHIEAINPSESTITVQDEEIPIGTTYKKLFFEVVRLLK